MHILSLSLSSYVGVSPPPPQKNLELFFFLNEAFSGLSTAGPGVGGGVSSSAGKMASEEPATGGSGTPKKMQIFPLTHRKAQLSWASSKTAGGKVRSLACSGNRGNI